jgi:uncharacterized protein YktA (UPF0223 family)
VTDTLHYPIDFEAYSIDEIENLVDFLASIEAYHETSRSVSKDALVKKHQTFRNILNNKSEEKRIDRAFKKQTGISIYKTMQSLK